MATEWFIYVQRKADGRRAIAAGPYPTQEAADARHYPTVAAAEASVKDGAWLWFETWGVCEATAGSLVARLGVV